MPGKGARCGVRVARCMVQNKKIAAIKNKFINFRPVMLLQHHQILRFTLNQNYQNEH